MVKKGGKVVVLDLLNLKIDGESDERKREAIRDGECVSTLLVHVNERKRMNRES